MNVIAQRSVDALHCGRVERVVRETAAELDGEAQGAAQLWQAQTRVVVCVDCILDSLRACSVRVTACLPLAVFG